jgi:hypothetical protein
MSVIIKYDSGLKKYIHFVQKMDQKLERDSIHNKNIVVILRYMALNSESSVREIANNCLTHVSFLTSERMIQRLFHGRTDRKKKSLGLIEDGIVQKTGDTFSLSFFGLLYAIKLCNFTTCNFNKIAKNYKEMLPYIFGKNEYLSKNKISLKPLIVIADGNPDRLERSIQASIPYQELYNYLNSQIPKMAISEASFRNYVSLWFYTYLLWDNTFNAKMIRKWKKIISTDNELKMWYTGFLFGAREFYSNRFKMTKCFLESVL